MNDADPTSSADLVEALDQVQASIAEVGAAMVELAVTMREEIRSDKRERLIMQVPTLVFVIAAAALALLNLANIRATQESTNLIVSCTSAGGECYVRNQRSATGAVRAINEAFAARTQQQTDEIVARLTCIQRDGNDCPPQPTTTTTSTTPTTVAPGG